MPTEPGIGGNAPQLTELVLITSGDPNHVTGGYLYHRRMAVLAENFQFKVNFCWLPDNVVAAWSASAWVRRTIARTRPKAILVDSISLAGLVPWVTRHRGPPVIGSLHQAPGGTDKSRAIKRTLDLMAYRKLATLICASTSLRDVLVEVGVPANTVHVVPPGRDLHGASTGWSKTELRRGRPNALLCVANWLPHKGILELLDAFAKLPHQLATLHLVGGHRHAGYSSRVWERLRSPELSRRVVVHGTVEPQRLPALFGNADAFVLPSVMEAFGTVYGEAMAFGLPVIGWRAGALPDLAEDGVEGLIAEPGDIGGLAERLREICENRELRTRLGSAAQARASRRPSWAESAAAYFRIVRQTLLRHDQASGSASICS